MARECGKYPKLKRNMQIKIKEPQMLENERDSFVQDAARLSHEGKILSVHANKTILIFNAISELKRQRTWSFVLKKYIL